MSDNQDRSTRIGLWIGGLAAGIAAVAVVGQGIGQGHDHLARQNQAAQAAATFELAPPSEAFSGDVQGVTPVYFEVGQATLSDSALVAVTDVAATLQADGGNVVLSGYHDASGTAQVNAEVSKQRAIAVRDALIHQGVPAERIQLAKPVELLGGDRPDEARRVDITLVR